MMDDELILVKRDKPYIRKKSNEGLGNIKEVHPNKIKTWVGFSEAGREARGATFMDVIDTIIMRTKGVVFKTPKPKTKVTREQYLSLRAQAMSKGISRKQLDELVEVEVEIPAKLPPEEILLEAILR